MPGEQEPPRYRRWRTFVGGPWDGRPTPEEAWARRPYPVYTLRDPGPEMAMREGLGPPGMADELPIDTTTYSERKLTVGRTRLVLKALVADDILGEEALERIWLQLLDAAGA